jgi:hypothetical protein
MIKYIHIKTIQTLTDSFTGFTLDIFLKYNFGVEAKYDFWQIRIDLCSVHQPPPLLKKRIVW